METKYCMRCGEEQPEDAPGDRSPGLLDRHHFYDDRQFGI